MPGREKERAAARVASLTAAARRSGELHQDDVKARDAAMWEYDDVHGDGSIRALARVTGLAPSHVHRIITAETARRQAAAAERLD